MINRIPLSLTHFISILSTNNSHSISNSIKHPRNLVVHSYQYRLHYHYFFKSTRFSPYVDASFGLRANRLDRIWWNPSEDAAKKAIVRRRIGRSREGLSNPFRVVRKGKSNNARPTTPCETSLATSVR